MDAEKHFSEAVRTCPLDPMARKLYADALWKRGAQGEAIEQMHECIRLAGALDVAQVVRLGEMYLQRGDLLRAEEQALEAIRIASDDGSAWVLRARVQRSRGKLEVALADFHRALSHDPDNFEVRLEVAELYNTIHRPERGLAILHALTEQVPEQEQSPRVALLEGLALQQLGRHYEAIEAFARAQQSGAPAGDVFLHSADSYLAMGFPDRARWAVEEAERSAAPSAAVQEARTRIAAVRMDPAATLQR